MAPPSKPLPLPPSLTIPKLTPDARLHFRQLLRNATDEHSLDPAWGTAIEVALDQFGECVDRGEWLSGIKSARILHSRHAQQPSSDSRSTSTSTSTAKSKDGDTLPIKKTREEILKRLLELATNSAAEPLISAASHLLVTLSPIPTATPLEDLDFDIIPSNIGCTFTPERFSFPTFEHDGKTHGDGGIILFGVEEWQDIESNIVGGSFSIRGASRATYTSLISILRISIFGFLAIMLETLMLRDSHIELRYPSPDSPALPNPITAPAPSPKAIHRNRFRGKAASGIWSYLTKKTERVLARASSRGGSLDISFGHGRSSSSSGAGAGGASVGGDGAGGMSSDIDDGSLDRNQEDDRSFISTLKRIKDEKMMLSTSPGMVFPPPLLIERLAAKEGNGKSFTLAGDEKSGLQSILGWESGMAKALAGGIEAFIRHQTLTVLLSSYVPTQEPTTTSSSSTATTATTTPTSESRPATPSVIKPCSRSRWQTYRYFSRHPEQDQTLGEFVQNICAGNVTCVRGECKIPRQNHEMQWIHGGIKIIGKLIKKTETTTTPSIEMWLSCVICKEKTDGQLMSDGTFLFSFGKYIEALIYSPKLSEPVPALCLHTTPPSPHPSSPPESRFNIIRHFSFNNYILSFTTSAVRDIFEVRVPRLQIIQKTPPPPLTAASSKSPQDTIKEEAEHTTAESDREQLRLEITHWWRSIKQHLRILEEYFNGDGAEPTPWRKPLPPSPPPEEETDGMSNPPNPIPPTPKSPPTPVRPRQPLSPPSSPVTSGPTPLDLLVKLRHSFQTSENTLYSDLHKASATSFNDVRRSFYSRAKAAVRRLEAWQSKHAVGAEISKFSARDPEWFEKGCYAIPGGNALVREGEWGSIIAFTLSSRDYQQELANISTHRLGPSISSSSHGSSAGSIPSKKTGSTKTASSKVDTPTLDPDNDAQSEQWHEPESWTAEITRKEHPKDISILSLREVLGNKRSDGSSLSSTFSSLGTRFVRGNGSATWAKPAVELNMEAADGSIIGPSDVDEKKSSSEHTDVTPTASTFTNQDITPTASTFTQTQVSTAGGSTIANNHSSDTVTGDKTPRRTSTPPPPALPPKDQKPTNNSSSSSQNGHIPAPLSFSALQNIANAEDIPTSEGGMASAVGSLTSSLASAMRYVLSVGSDTALNALTPPTDSAILGLDSPAIDEHPHIRYQWTIGQRLRFSCTVYYAKQFDSLRRRCGVDEMLVKSLRRSENWAAEGGKSKSNFWKTSDDRYIIKSLVNAWNVADLQVLNELAPSYFRYIDSTANKASVLAKLLGFYTVEIKNLETGAIQSKADLLVMENLFFEQKISRTFDLKGIQGRRVKAKGKGDSKKTLFDGEWIEGQQRAMILVQPHSKRILLEAVGADAEFLAKSNIMDYSLLLGIDDERRQIACGLVDTIGSYTFAKTLEYKAKHNLLSGEVTVIPPAEYQERFVNAMDNYFLACPDKWTKPFASGIIPSQVSDLPSVL